MSFKEILEDIKNYKPLTIFQFVEINKLSNSDKMILFEEYNLVIAYLINIIELGEKL
jgi:hypothetical protein